ncbi:MAG: hypothetical protein WAW39_18245 [Prosthecobacter sp.]|uniref:hypothetical protein n=1 Tax=Prosthecobacter sp. TaxID=1965333 RepID=UPI003BB154B3
MTTELPQTHVQLRAYNGASEISVQDFLGKYSWSGVGAGGEADPEDPCQFMVSRANPGRTIVQLKRNTDGAILSEMHVWVVWATVKQEQGDTQFEPVQDGSEIYATWTIVQEVGKQKRFVFQIQPKSITDLTADIPDLTGAAAAQHPPPGSNTHCFTDYNYDPENTTQPIPVVSGDTAASKWDVSRQAQVTITNTDRIPKDALKSVWPPSVCVGQDVATPTIPVPFPALDYQGNDDPRYAGGTDENDDPYHVRPNASDDLQHEVGELTSVDSPTIAAAYDWVTKDGMKLEYKYDFREFARIQLWDNKRTAGQFWFRISNLSEGEEGQKGEWHHHAKFKSEIKSEIKSWINDGSSPVSPP